MVVLTGAAAVYANCAVDVIPPVLIGVANSLIRFYKVPAEQITALAPFVAGSAAGGAVTGAAASTAVAAYFGITGMNLASKSLSGAICGMLASSASALTMVEGSPLAAASTLGLVGCLTLGASGDINCGGSFDCWKPIVRDWSAEPSTGRLLFDVSLDKRVRDLCVSYTSGGILPRITLENVWNEKFAVDYVVLPSGELACHARRL